ncbi:MAG TPA: amidohydrolase family protein [Patescibacteria group bacterium]|nr:amidohydrolase family protein [Patescibacteria group bacterium]
MRPTEFIETSVIDCHVHTWMLRRTLDKVMLRQQGEALEEIATRGRLDKIYAFDSGAHAPLYLKAAHPGLLYAGGYAPWSGGTDQLPDPDWEGHISTLIELGYDGVGEMGSKPAPRDVHVPLDSSYYEDFWEACEERQFPVLCHIGDVEDFWHEETTPSWAKERGWGYWKGDYPALEELYAETEGVLNAHPGLPVVLCHFLFLSPHLERAEEFLDAHPSAHLDLSLGVELMYNISRRRDMYREFFRRHDDRILFGTDIGMSTTLPQHLARITMLRRFLETGDEFHTPDSADDLLTRYELPYVGLDLPRRSLKKIYAGNFRRLWGKEPREVDIEAAISECRSGGNPVVAKALEGLV